MFDFCYRLSAIFSGSEDHGGCFAIFGGEREVAVGSDLWVDLGGRSEREARVDRGLEELAIGGLEERTCGARKSVEQR